MTGYWIYSAVKLLLFVAVLTAVQHGNLGLVILGSALLITNALDCPAITTREDDR